MTEKDIINTVLDTAAETMDDVEREVTDVMKPLHKSVFSRFPILFMLLVTFGVSAIFFGFERVIMETAFLYNHPWFLIGVGTFVLVATGTLYKKLG